MQIDHSSEVQWREWSDEAFKQAEKEDKLILLDLTAAWCHWCHVMDRTTYSHPQVVKMLNERFIPIKVNADQRPDIQDKYLLGGWPTTAFLIPDGRILTGTTFMPPEAMIQKLKEVDMLYHEHKQIVTMHVTSMAAEAEADRTEAETPVGRLNGQVIESLVQALKQSFDRVHGGFGTEPKFPYPDAVRFAFLQYRNTGDPEMLDMALKTLDAMTGIRDPVWGGFYRYAADAAWKQSHYEKILYVQAGMMDNYLEAYQVTGDDKYGEVAVGIKAYVTKFLSDREKGGFYGSQDTDPSNLDLDQFIPGEEYYAKDEEGRLAIGIPCVDKTIYTDWNSLMISAYLHMYHAMGDVHARDFALKTIDRILAENMRDGRMYHYGDGEPRLEGLLSDHVHFAQALIDAYQSTGAREYLLHAEKLVGVMAGRLQDVLDGGFYFEFDRPRAKSAFYERHKPFDENAAAARLLTQLYYLTGCKDYRELAERTLNAIAYPQISESIIGMSLGIAADLFLDHPLHVVIVGDREDERARRMLETSLHAYDPRKLVQLLDPKEGPLTIGEMTYQPADEPIAYVCMDNLCRPPAKSEDLPLVLEEVIVRR